MDILKKKNYNFFLKVEYLAFFLRMHSIQILNWLMSTFITPHFRGPHSKLRNQKKCIFGSKFWMTASNKKPFIANFLILSFMYLPLVIIKTRKIKKILDSNGEIYKSTKTVDCFKLNIFFCHSVYICLIFNLSDCLDVHLSTSVHLSGYLLNI